MNPSNFWFSAFYTNKDLRIVNSFIILFVISIISISCVTGVSAQTDQDRLILSVPPKMIVDEEYQGMITLTQPPNMDMMGLISSGNEFKERFYDMGFVPGMYKDEKYRKEMYEYEKILERSFPKEYKYCKEIFDMVLELGKNFPKLTG